MSNLEMRKYGFFRVLKIEDINECKDIKKSDVKDSYSIMKYGTNYKDSNIRKNTNSIMYINFDRFIEAIKVTNKEDKIKGFFKYIESVHHELGHLEQHVAIDKSSDIIDISSADALKYALESSLINADPEKYYIPKEEYNRTLTEENARQKGLNAIIDIFDGKNKYDIYVKNMKKKRIEKNLNEYFIDLEEYNEAGKMFDRSSRNCMNIDNLCHDNRIISRCNNPILNKMYNKDGSRKKTYELVEDYMAQNSKLENNKKISNEEKQKEIRDINDFYSEIFWISINRSNIKEFLESKENLGNRELEHMFSMTRDYFNNQHNHFNDVAKEKYTLREEVYGSNSSNLEIYNNRLKLIDNRFKSISQDISKFEEIYLSDISRKKSSISNQEKVKEDTEKVENNFKQNDLSNKNEKSTCKVTSQTSSRDALDVKLGSMRDTRDEYRDYQQLLILEQEETEKEYYELLEMQKSQKVIDTNKEK